ncbi:Der1-like family-domain-containing protein [Lipomyces kononenkoae]|uniref:Der1-like family-domain-containing protein n=1 Tax=Lipomyces kononenkoae TaxID=34357 RepID=A0ACC3T7J8_LIPKO
MANEILDFINSVPPITRVFLLGTLGTTFGTLLNAISPALLVNYWPQTALKLQLWRPFTAFFVVGGDPMSKLMEIYMFYTYSKDLEMEKFRGYTADYLYFLTLVGGVIAGLNYFTRGIAYMAPLLVALTYIWSQYNPDRVVQFYFGITFKAKYLPAVLLAFKLLVEGQASFLISATGVAAAYLYQQLETSQPGSPPSPWVQTPQWMKKLLPAAWSAESGWTTDTRNVRRSFGSAYYPSAGSRRPGPSSSASTSARADESSASFRWGRGRRLGGS